MPIQTPPSPPAILKLPWYKGTTHYHAYITEPKCILHLHLQISFIDIKPQISLLLDEKTGKSAKRFPHLAHNGETSFPFLRHRLPDEGKKKRYQEARWYLLEARSRDARPMIAEIALHRSAQLGSARLGTASSGVEVRLGIADVILLLAQVYHDPKTDSECLSNIRGFLKACASLRLEVSSNFVFSFSPQCMPALLWDRGSTITLRVYLLIWFLMVARLTGWWDGRQQ